MGMDVLEELSLLTHFSQLAIPVNMDVLKCIHTYTNTHCHNCLAAFY